MRKLNYMSLIWIKNHAVAQMSVFLKQIITSKHWFYAKNSHMKIINLNLIFHHKYLVRVEINWQFWCGQKLWFPMAFDIFSCDNWIYEWFWWSAMVCITFLSIGHLMRIRKNPFYWLIDILKVNQAELFFLSQVFIYNLCLVYCY